MKINKKLILLFISGLLCSAIRSQDCTEEKAAQTIGKWLPVKDYSSYEPEAANAVKIGRTKMLATMDSIIIIVKKTIPQPVGFDGLMIRNIWGGSDVDSTFLDYELYSHYYDYYCTSDKKLKRVNEANTTFRIGVNVLNQENFTRKQFAFDPVGVLLYTVPPPDGRVQGFPAYQMFSSGEDPKTWVERRAVLVTRDSTEKPFTPVTKAEFYALLKRLITVKRDDQKAGLKRTTKIRPREVQEAELKAAMDEIDNSSLGADAKTARKNRLKQDFMTDEQALNERLKQVDMQYQGYLDRLAEMEKFFIKELQRPVFCPEYEFNLNNLNTSFNNQHLYNDSLHGYMIVKMNPAYFRKTTDKWKPQFMLVTWTRENGFAFSRNLETVWRNKLDFSSLRSMLVK